LLLMRETAGPAPRLSLLVERLNKPPDEQRHRLLERLRALLVAEARRLKER